MQLRPLLTLALLLLASRQASAIVTSDSYGSHVVTPGMITFGLNLDGIVALEGFFPVQCTGILIADRFLLTGAHCVDVDEDGFPDTDDFFALKRARFDLPDGPLFVDLLPSQTKLPPQWATNPQGDADIAVMTLATDAPAGVPRYPLYGSTNEVGGQVVVVGYGVPGFGQTGGGFFDDDGTKRAGLNRIEARGEDFDNQVYTTDPGLTLIYDFDSGLRANNSLSLLGVTSDLGFGPDEVALGSGDSGGPLFIDGLVAGINARILGGYPSDVTDGADGSWGDLIVSTRVSAFQEFITTATEGHAVFVPEPSTWTFTACALTGTAICLLRRQRMRNHRSL